MKDLTYILDIELEDDDTQNGGIAFVGETVRDFLDYCIEDSAESGEDLCPHNIDELNAMLTECGIKPIVVERG